MKYLVLLSSFFLSPFLLNGQGHRNESDLFHPSHLSGKTITINVTYSAISCVCAQWVETKADVKSSHANPFWLEPANNSLPDADKMWDGKPLPFKLKVTGQFYTEKGWPKRKFSKGHGESAGIFRYEKMEIIK